MLSVRNCLTIEIGRAAALVFALAFACPSLAQAAEPTGTWLTHDQDAKIRVSRCGNGICGTIVWLKEPIDPKTGKPHVDDKNSDPKKQNRRIIGLRIFSLSPRDAGTWSGKIYNADNGRTYDAKISAPSATTLEVQGCAGPFCGSETWTRIR